jgi:5-methylcytosine-specific restriction endonuclease McrA
MTLVMKRNKKELIEETHKLVREERSITLKVLLNLKEIEENLYHLDEHSSLFEMCVKEFKYSEGAAQRRITAMRLLREVPSLSLKLEEGSLNLTNLSLAASFFKSEETPFDQKKEILLQIENTSTRQVEKILDSYSSSPKKKKIQLEVDEELLEKLSKLKALHSHKNLSELELLHRLMDQELKKFEPKAKPQKETTSLPAPEVKAPRYISQSIQKELRAKGQCEYVSPKGQRCTSTHYLQIHHVQAYAKGGSNELKNLKLFCRAHNFHAGVKDFGLEKMTNFRRP